MIVESLSKVGAGFDLLASLLKAGAGGWACQIFQYEGRSRLGCHQGGCRVRGPVPAQVFVATSIVAFVVVDARRYRS